MRECTLIPSALLNGPGVLPIDQLDLPDRPILVMNPTFPKGDDSLEPGRSHVIPLGVDDPRIKVSLIAGPDGAEVKGNELHWTPAHEDVGLVKLQFKLGEEGDTRSTIHEVDCRVGVRPYPIDFKFIETRLSVDGRHAMAWRNQIEERNGGFVRGKFAVVQTDDHLVLHEGPIQMKLKDAALSDEFCNPRGT